MRSALACGLAAALLAAPAYAASAVDGLWRTPVKHGVLEVYDCGDQVCARVVTSDTLKANPEERDLRNRDPTLRSRPMKGLVIISGMSGGPSDWKGGHAYNPEDGKTYAGSMRLTGPDTLTLTGCVVFPFCQSRTWTRVR